MSACRMTNETDPAGHAGAWNTTRSTIGVATMMDKTTRTRALGGLLAGLLLISGACSDDPMGPRMEQAPRILLDKEVVLSESHREVVTFSARILGADGREVDLPLEWATDNTDVLEALGDGSFRTLANGTASVQVRISRSHPSVSRNGYFANVPDADALVHVEQAARRLALFNGDDGAGEPGGGSSAVTAIDVWAIDELLELAALPADEQGQVVAGFDVGALEWTSGDESIFTVDENGRVTPVGDGETTIRVSGDGLTGTIVVRVRATQSIRACARMGEGGESEASAGSCSSLRLTFTRGG
jgi:hypothetical protein